MSARDIIANASAIVTNEAALAKQAHDELMSRVDGWSAYLRAEIATAQTGIVVPNYTVTWGDLTIKLPTAWGAAWSAPAAPSGGAVGAPTAAPPTAVLGSVLAGTPVIGAEVFQAEYDATCGLLAEKYLADMTAAANVTGMLSELPGEALITRLDAVEDTYTSGRDQAAMETRAAQVKAWSEDAWKAVAGQIEVWLGEWKGIGLTSAAKLQEMRTAEIPARISIDSQTGRREADAARLTLAGQNAGLVAAKGAAETDMVVSYERFIRELRVKLEESLLGVMGNTLSAYLSGAHIGMSASSNASLGAGASASSSDTETYTTETTATATDQFSYTNVTKD